jgi:hypothetical protein
MSTPVIARSIAELDAIPTMPAILEVEYEPLSEQIHSVRAELDRQAAALNDRFDREIELASDTAMAQLFELIPYLEKLVDSYRDDVDNLPYAISQLLASMIGLTDQALEIHTGGSESLRLKRSRLRLVALRARLVNRERRHEPRARLVAIAKPSRHEALDGLEAHAPPPVRALATTRRGAA